MTYQEIYSRNVFGKGGDRGVCVRESFFDFFGGRVGVEGMLLI